MWLNTFVMRSLLLKVNIDFSGEKSKWKVGRHGEKYQ
jgi:hypothetical protein